MRTGRDNKFLTLVSLMLMTAFFMLFTIISSAEDGDITVERVDVVDVWTMLDSASELPFTAEINPNDTELSNQIEIIEEEWVREDGAEIISRSATSLPKKGYLYYYAVTVGAQTGYAFDREAGFDFVYGGTEYNTDDIEVEYLDDGNAVRISGFINPAYTDYMYNQLDNGEVEITKFVGTCSEADIPKQINGHTVTSLASVAFYNKDELRKITIPNTIDKIEEYAFGGCEVLRTVIYNSDADIPVDAFCYCPWLLEVQINGHPKVIGDSAFDFCNRLERINMPEKLEEIGEVAFRNTAALKTLNLPASLKSIGKEAFTGSGVNKFTVSANNTNYSAKGGVLFNKKGTELILYPEGRTAIHYSVPSGTVTIGEKAFYYSNKLKQLDFPDTLQVIGKYALPNALPKNGCIEMVFPKSLSTIEAGNAALPDGRKIYYKGTKAQWKKIIVDYYNNDGLNPKKNTSIVYNHNKNGIKLSKTTINCTLEERPKVTITYANGREVKNAEISITNKQSSIAKTRKGTSGKSSVILITPQSKGACKACVFAGGYAKDITINVTGQTPMSKATVKDLKNQTYTGKALKPKFNLYFEDTCLGSANYSYKYSSNTKVGTAKITVTGKGKYCGSKTITFKILPKPTKFRKVTSANKSIILDWTKVTKETTGYQIEYGLKNNFKDAKPLTIKDNKTAKKKIAKLKSKKKYYVRIRTYKMIKRSNGNKEHYYSKWSKGYGVKTK